MKHITTILITAVIFGSALMFIDQQRLPLGDVTPRPVRTTSSAATSMVVRASGRIEGRTQEVELRARIAEQITEIHVEKGQWVSKDDLLVSLDSARFESERDLAASLLAREEATKTRLENGFRESEIETARQEYAAAKARQSGAEKAYKRGLKLYSGNAFSQQSLDDLYTNMVSLKALTAAAKGRLETMEAPAREDELLAAKAAVRAAESRLRIAQINLDRTMIKAPSDGQILAVEAEPGELTTPEDPSSLIVMSDTSRLRTVAEVDEYDALSIRVGQTAHITSDGAEGVLGRGEVVEVEPQMTPKKLFGQWAGERTDTYSRRVWIELRETEMSLPVGLPVDVYIEVSSEQE